MKSRRNLRTILFDKNPLCSWCGKLTRNLTPDELLPGESIGELATIDHVKSRREVRSLQEYAASANKVLACHGCNQRRNNEFQKQNPLKDPNTPPVRFKRVARSRIRQIKPSCNLVPAPVLPWTNRAVQEKIKDYLAKNPARIVPAPAPGHTHY